MKRIAWMFVGLVLLFAVLISVLVLRSSTSEWNGQLRVERFSSTFHGATRLELCAHGHFDEGFWGEVKWTFRRAGYAWTECFDVQFDAPPTPGTFVISGVGERGPMPASFTADQRHATSIRSVWLEEHLSSGPPTELVPFQGTLTLEAMNPPRGHLLLDVGGARPLKVDIELARFPQGAR